MPPTKKLSQGGSVAGAHDEAASVAILADDLSFSEALDALGRRDATLAAALSAAGCAPRLRRREPGFPGLAAIIVSQQVSTASANAIFGRLQARLPVLDAANLLAATDDDLRACGLSAPKTRTLRAVAAAVAGGQLDFGALATADANAAHAALCAIKGIGPWTADIFLLFCLGNADAWPAGDLALQEGARLALGLPTRPDTQALVAIGERWRPLRGVAAHCLWAYYGAMRGRPSTLESPQPRANAPRRVRRKERSA